MPPHSPPALTPLLLTFCLLLFLLHHVPLVDSRRAVSIRPDRRLQPQLSSLQGFRLQHEIQQPGIVGQLTLTDIRTTGFQPPLSSHISFAAPSYSVLSVEDMSISIAARFLGTSGLIQVPGGVHGQLVGL